MARIPFEEKLIHREVIIENELYKLQDIFENSLKDDAKILFDYFDVKFGCFDSDEFMNLVFLNSNSEDVVLRYLDYCDFFLLFIKPLKVFNGESHPYEKMSTDFVSIYSGIIFVLNKIDYGVVVTEDEKYLIVQKNTVAEEIAGSPTYSDIKWKVLEYNAHNTNLEEKKAILVELYKKFEDIRPNLKETNKPLEKELAGLIQCVRHTKNRKGLEPYSFYYDDEEKWCDKLYDLLLECFIHEDNKAILDEIKELKGE